MFWFLRNSLLVWLLFKGYYLYCNMSLTKRQKLTQNASVRLKCFLISFMENCGNFFFIFFFLTCHSYLEQTEMLKSWTPGDVNTFLFTTLAVHGALQTSGARKAIRGKVTEGVSVWRLDRGEWEGEGSPPQTEGQGKGMLLLPSL